MIAVKTACPLAAYLACDAVQEEGGRGLVVANGKG